MRELSAEILELIRLTSTDLPAGVEADLKKAMEAEKARSLRMSQDRK